MPRRLTALAAVALVVGACGGGGAAATSAPTTAPTQAAATSAPATAEVTEAPTDTGGSGGGGGGAGSSQSADALKALAQRLSPAGSTETGHLEANGVYQLYLSTTMSLDQLKTFYDGLATSIPIKDYTKVDASGSLYIGGSDPVLAIIAAPDPQKAGAFTVVISVGG